MDVDVEKVVREYTEPLMHMSLATSENNAPWVCEVHFALDGMLNIYFRSLSSRRHSQQIAKNPQVAGNIIKEFRLGEPPLGVYFEGTAELVANDEERQKAFAAMQPKLQTQPEALEEARRTDGHQFYKITVSNWYVFGKFGDAPTQKYQLVWNGGNR